MTRCEHIEALLDADRYYGPALNEKSQNDKPAEQQMQDVKDAVVRLELAQSDAPFSDQLVVIALETDLHPQEVNFWLYVILQRDCGITRRGKEPW